MKAIIKDTLGADKTIEVKDGNYISTPYSIKLESATNFILNPYKSIYVTVDTGIIDVIIGQRAFQLESADGTIEVKVLESDNEIVGLFV